MSAELKIKLKNEHVTPVVGSASAAGMDLRADTNELLIEAGREYTFCTGVAIEIPENWVGLVMPRSGLGNKKGMRLKNSTGVIDSDYRGYIKVTCTFTETFWLESYERIVQMVVVPHHPLHNLVFVGELSETGRGATGFGSSGRV